MKKLTLILLLIFIHKNSNEHNIIHDIRPVSKITKEITKEINTTKMIIDVNKYIGIKYLYGGTTKSGIDCSSLVQHIYSDNNIKIPRTTKYQSKLGKNIKFKNLIRGDLIFFSNGHSKTISHVAIYLGNNNILHATSSKGVTITNFKDRVWNKYWLKRFIKIKRCSN